MDYHGTEIRNVVLEVSLKPFARTDERSLRATATELFGQWQALTRWADQISVMLWTGDGSELLDFSGDMDAPFDWARYIGHANKPFADQKVDPRTQRIHEVKYLYMENPPVMTYTTLKRIVAVVKEVGTAMSGKPVFVGTTVDPGPEFAESTFKYERHPEVCADSAMGSKTFIYCYATLHADTRVYAGFPKGIPEGTPFGTFLGRQARHFLPAIGFDYLWLSNGIGFGLDTWRTIGALFDGKEFFPEKAQEIRDRILGFWESFRAECKFRVETRGSNFTTGIDLATDASPIAEIYGRFDITPPPNSPWAAMDGDFGLELTGYLSRLVKRPGRDFLFRFYLHDPWWVNSPWLDRYQRAAHDLYLPLACGIVNSEGAVERPNQINLLTVDDSYGRMPPECPNEIIPHLLTALTHAPDAPSPVVWVYPFHEYHAFTFSTEQRIEEPFFGDWLMRGALNHGLPLSTVVATDDFCRLKSQRPEFFLGSVLITPVPVAGSEFETALLAAVEKGQSAVLYGPVTRASETLRRYLGLGLAPSLVGEGILETTLDIDTLRSGSHPRAILHRPEFCAGGIDTVAQGLAPEELVARFHQGGLERAVAVLREIGKGRMGWIRGTVSNSYQGGHLLAPDDPNTFFPGEILFRWMLARFGWRFSVDKGQPGYPSRVHGGQFTERSPLTLISRRDNGFFFSGHVPNTNDGLSFTLPQGAPLFNGIDGRYAGGSTHWRFGRWWHHECRCFISQVADAEILCIENFSGSMGFRRRLYLSGLSQTRLRFYPEPGTVPNLVFQPNPPTLHYASIDDKSLASFRVERDESGESCVVEDLTGTLMISW